MNNIIRLKRSTFTDKTTIGELYMPDGTFLAYTLEDAIRRYKEPGKTAIPCGTYEVIIGWSNRYDRLMPRLLSVPFFEGILIHQGNDEADTSGCILVGKNKGVDVIWDSYLAFEDVFPKLRRMCGEGKVFIDIEGGFKASEWEAKVDPAPVPVDL